jgi:hypothetical protein
VCLLKIDIARQLISCPRSVVILHDVEKLPSEMKTTRFGSVGGLISLERFFEDQYVEVNMKRVVVVVVVVVV